MPYSALAGVTYLDLCSGRLSVGQAGYLHAKILLATWSYGAGAQPATWEQTAAQPGIRHKWLKAYIPTMRRTLVQELIPGTPPTRGGVTEAVFGGNIPRIP